MLPGFEQIGPQMGKICPLKDQVDPPPVLVGHPTNKAGHPIGVDHQTVMVVANNNQDWSTNHPNNQGKNPSRPSNQFEMGHQSSTAQCWNCGKLGHVFLK